MGDETPSPAPCQKDQGNTAADPPKEDAGGCQSAGDTSRAKANGVIHCRISGQCCCVTFTPDPPHWIEHGQDQFVAFVPEGAKYGFVAKLCNGRKKLVANGLCPSLLSQVALSNTKVTVVVSRLCDGGLKLEELIVPAEDAK